MAKPYRHAQSSVKKWGGSISDYLPIHDLMDSTKSAIPSQIHRTIFHNAWAIGPDGPLEKIFGKTITNSNGRIIVTRDIFEQHIIEDLGFIPTLSDYLQDVPIQDWMYGKARGLPPSANFMRKHNDYSRTNRPSQKNDSRTGETES